MKRLLVMIAAAAAMSACASSAVASNTPLPSASSSPSPNASSAKAHGVDPCALVTAAEASAAAGRALVNDVTLGAAPVSGGCFYGARGTTAGFYVYMQVYPDAATADAVTVEQFQSVMAGTIGSATSDAQSVGGIGDRAYEFAAKGRAGAGIALIVFKANVVFLVALEPTTHASTVEGVAKTAAGRLH